MAIIMSMYNNKGGVCKSTLISMLSQYYCSKGLKVLVIDMDPSSNSTHYFFRKRGGTQRNFRKTLKNLLDPDDPTTKLSSVIYKSERVENLYVVPSEFDLDLVEFKMVRQGSSESPEPSMVLKNAITEYLSEPSARFPEFDIIFLDLHPSRRSALNYCALVASDYVWLPSDKDIETIEGLGSCVEVVKEMQRYNPDLKFGGIIYVKFTGGKVDYKRAVPELMYALGDNTECRLLKNVIPFVSVQDELRWTRRAVFSGQISKKNEKLAAAYADLGNEMLEIIGLEK